MVGHLFIHPQIQMTMEALVSLSPRKSKLILMIINQLIQDY